MEYAMREVLKTAGSVNGSTFFIEAEVLGLHVINVLFSFVWSI
jgi:hypothetical protein